MVQLQEQVPQPVQRVEQPQQPLAEQMAVELYKQQVQVHQTSYNVLPRDSALGRVDRHPFYRHRQP
jgi:hypothetical protein